MADKKHRYAFKHGVQTKWFGPYSNMDEARDAFQRAYGYWPGILIAKEEWR